MADDMSLSDRQMNAELDKQRQTAARLLDSLAARLGTLASHGSRVAAGAQRAARGRGGSVRRAATRFERAVRRRPAMALLSGVVAGFAAALVFGRLRGGRRL